MGEHKATMLFAGKPLWEIASANLDPLVHQVIFVDSGSSTRFPDTCRVIRDDPPGYGPLGGIVTGLEQSGHTHHLVLAVDYPLVQGSLLRRLLARASDGWAVCGRSSSFLEPLIAYYNSACAPVIRTMIAEREIRTHQLYERVPSLILDDAEYEAVDPRRFSQFNVNTPEDLKRAMAIYRDISSDPRERAGQ